MGEFSASQPPVHSGGRFRFVRPNLVFFVLSLVAGGVFGRLGFWQLGRLAERRRANAETLARRELPVVSLGQETVAGESQPVNRRVVVQGQYDRTHEIVLRNYALGGVPGVRVVTPLRPLLGDTATLILRGFVPAPDAITPATDSLDEPGVLKVSGVALNLPDSGGGEPIEFHGRTTWRRLDLAALRARIPYPLRAVYVIETADSGAPLGPGRNALPRRVDPPALDEGPHLSYALQWFAFAISGVTVGGVLAFGKPRRLT